jgi:hypothetical protein
MGDMDRIFKDLLDGQVRAHVYTANVVHEPWRIVGIELHNGTKDVELMLTVHEAEELGNALLEGAKEIAA